MESHQIEKRTNYFHVLDIFVWIKAVLHIFPGSHYYMAVLSNTSASIAHVKPIADIHITSKTNILLVFFLRIKHTALNLTLKIICSHAFKKETKTISQIYLETNTTRHLMLLKLLCLYYIISFGLILKS